MSVLKIKKSLLLEILEKLTKKNLEKNNKKKTIEKHSGRDFIAITVYKKGTVGGKCLSTKIGLIISIIFNLGRQFSGINLKFWFSFFYQLKPTYVRISRFHYNLNIGYFRFLIYFTINLHLKYI